VNDLQSTSLRTAALWAGMIGAPITWAIHMLVVWFVNEFGCRVGLPEPLILALLILAGGVAGGAILAAGFIAYRNWRYLDSVPLQAREADEEVWQRSHFMAVTGIGFSALFLLVVAYMTIPIFLLPACS
jgi:hypothetical protein